MKLINIFLLLLFGCAINARRGGSHRRNGHSAPNPPDGSSSEECISEKLPPDLHCDSDAFYRTIDGRCNNLHKPLYGATKTPFLRILDPHRDDTYIECPTDGTDSYVNDLPTPLEVSNALFEMKDDEPNNLVETTSLFTYFGQFLDHDITLTDNEELRCNNTNASCDQECFEEPMCPMYEHSENSSPRQCFPFTRSTKTCDSKTKRKLLKNSITSFIDGSQIYGSSEDVSSSLRKHQSGQLTMQEGTFGDLLPENHNSNHPCIDRGGCFLAGDIRINEHIALTSLHTLFSREHNRIAKEIEDVTADQGIPGWDDEKIFLAARKIVGAIMQRIVYHEYLPLLDVNITPQNYFNDIDPSILLEFNTAAFRFGHSQVKPNFKIIHDANNIEYVPLRRTFFNTTEVRSSGIAAILTGLVDESSEVVDTNFAKDLGEHLFIPEDDIHNKQNLAALNIQRGRDHRLAGYKRYFQKYSSESYESLVPQSTRNLYNELYRRNDDKIDLYAAGLKEISFGSTILGPTFRGIINDQFVNLQKGDRFFYTNYFNEDAINEIETIHLSSIFCRNLNIDSIQKYVFKNKDVDDNPERNCRDDLKMEYNITLFLTEFAPQSGDRHIHQNGRHGGKTHHTHHDGDNIHDTHHDGDNTRDTYHKELRYHPRKGSN